MKLYCIKKKLSLLILSLAVFVQAQNRIIGGNEAPPEFGLFHASLQNLTGHHVCGGAVVSKWHILTAAHCVDGAKPEYIRVIVGTTNLDQGGLNYNVESISICNTFNFTQRTNDVAILKVKETFNLNYVRIIPLNDEFLLEGDIVFLSGFGAKIVNGESSNEMHLLTIPVFSQETCRYAMRYTRDVTDNMFCTFTKIGQGTCKGDSGSPIIKDDKLVGIVSWGIPCAVGFPDVHTRVAPFVKWIRTVIRNDICGFEQK